MLLYLCYATNSTSGVVSTAGSNSAFTTAHTLRDTFASRLLQQGMSLHKLSKLLGHTTITQTAKYAQLENLDVVNEAREIMDTI